jgi:hypothetical protein
MFDSVSRSIQDPYPYTNPLDCGRVQSNLLNTSHRKGAAMISSLLVRARTPSVLAAGAVVVVLAGGSLALASAGHSDAKPVSKSYVKQQIHKLEARLATKAPMWAYVRPNGTIGEHTAGIKAVLPNSFLADGDYYLLFPKAIAGDDVSVTPHFDESGQETGQISVAVCGFGPEIGETATNGAEHCDKGPNTTKELFVDIVDSSGADANQGFYVTVTP